MTIDETFCGEQCDDVMSFLIPLMKGFWLMKMMLSYRRGDGDVSDITVIDRYIFGSFMMMIQNHIKTLTTIAP